MLNKVILMGRLVADPELRQTPTNISVCRFRIAVDRGYSADKEKKADFITVVAWRATAEFVSKYFSKGKMIIVEGALHNADYTDANNVKHYAMEVTADKVTFGETKSANTVDREEAEKNSADIAKEIGNLGDFEEIISDGDLPF
jgi:single-strand DNA-binding protein